MFYLINTIVCIIFKDLVDSLTH